MNYYFLSSAIPDLQVGYPPDITFNEFQNLLKVNLTAEDYVMAEAMRRFYDIQNIRSFWKEEELDHRGNFNEKEIEEALITRTGFPEYVYDFLDRFESEEDRLNHFPWVVAAYFSEELKKAKGFLFKYLTFEREWRLVLIGFRAKKLDRDLAVELQYEDPDDDVVAQILAQKDARSYEPPSRYEELKGLFEEHDDEPLDLYQALCEYRFQKLENFYQIDFFSVDRILAYLAQLVIVEKWMELDKQKGLELVKTMIS